MSEPDSNDKHTGYQFRFWFLDVQPVIWRRLLLRADNTLADLHYAIQITCNWSDDFLHQFKIHGKNIGIPRIHGISYSESANKVKQIYSCAKMNASSMNTTSMSIGS